MNYSFKHLLIIFLCLFSVVFTAEQASAASCVTLNDSYRTRPNAKHEVTPVDVAVYVLNVQSINDVNQNYIIDMVAELKWKDSRLIVGTSETGRETCTYKLDDVWNPEIYIFNLDNAQRLLPRDVEVSPDGTVKYLQRLHGSLLAPLDLRNFPFDTQKLPIEMLSFKYGPDKIKLTFNEANSGRNSNFTITDWKIGVGTPHVGQFTVKSSYVPESQGNFSFFELDFEAKRLVMYYVWKIIIPMMLIVFMSWAVFWVDPKNTAAQLGLSATTILTMIAFLFSLNSLLPKVSYLTKFDFFIVSSIALVFLSFIEAITTCAMATNDHQERASRIDHYSRMVFPAVFATILIIFFSRI